MSNVVSSKYLVVVEKSQTGYSAYSPEVLGCAATGKTIADLLADEFAGYFKSSAPVLSDYAVSREGIYEDHLNCDLPLVSIAKQI